MEIWVSIHDDFYEVSNLGNVRRSKPGISTFIGRPVSPNLGAGGYLQVHLGGVNSKRYYVHHLVAMAFFGSRPDGCVVNHKDCNRQNNNMNNLEYITYSENSKHAFVLNGRPKDRPRKPPQEKKGKQIGDKHWMRRNPEKIRKGEELKSKLTSMQILEIRKKRLEGCKYKDLCSEYGISMAHASRICLNKRWRHL